MGVRNDHAVDGRPDQRPLVLVEVQLPKSAKLIAHAQRVVPEGMRAIGGVTGARSRGCRGCAVGLVDIDAADAAEA